MNDFKNNNMSHGSPPPTSVYGVSVDSRARPEHESDAKYTVSLGRTLDRVKSVQLGSFQFQDARPAFGSGAVLRYSEPLTISPETYIRFTETTSVVDTRSGARTVSTRNLTMYLPPTLNEITSMNNGTLVCTTSSSHGLLFGVHYYPLVGLRMELVGGDFPQDLHAFVTPTFPTDSPRPVLTSATVVNANAPPSANSFTWTSSYLNELTSGVGSLEARMVDVPNYTSFVHAPRPTLVELCTMLNAAVSDMVQRVDVSGTVVGATNASPIVLTTSGVHGLHSGDEIVVSGVSGNAGANGTFFVTVVSSTSLELDGSGGTGVYTGGGVWSSPQTLHVPVTFGFDHDAGTFVVSAPTRVTPTSSGVTTTRSSMVSGPLVTLLGLRSGARLDPPAFVEVANMPFVREVGLKVGTFEASDVASFTSARWNAGDFRSLEEADRTLTYALPSGVTGRVVVDVGVYTGTALAAYLTHYLLPSPSQIRVVYTAESKRFTFTHDLGLNFSLDFSESSTMAERLGFDVGGVYSGASTYTSIRTAVYGVSAVQPHPSNTYIVRTDESQRAYTLSTNAPTRLFTWDGSSVLGSGGAWAPTTEAATIPYAHAFQVGDILVAKRPTLSSTQSGTKNMTDASNTSPIVVTTATAHGLVAGDNVSVEGVEGNTAANGTWEVGVVSSPTTFELVGSEGDGSYVSGTGVWWTNVSFVTGVQRPSAMYEVVVSSVWDASTGVPLLTLAPTASLFSTEDAGTSNRETLGVPSPTDGLILMQSARRNVFMLHVKGPEGSASTFGFPPVSWPVSASTSWRDSSSLHGVVGGVGVATTYTSPYSWTLLPPDYILVVIRVKCGGVQDMHTHTYHRGESVSIFAKMLVNAPYVHILEEMHFTTFPGAVTLNQLSIEFQNPDGTLVDFNGRPHTYSLLFTLYENGAVLPCI